MSNYDYRLSINETNSYPSEGYTASKEETVVEKDGRSWKNITYTKEHGLGWQFLMGVAAMLATLGTFGVGAFLIDGIKKLWERACTGKEVVIVSIEQKNLNDEQHKVATKGQEILNSITDEILDDDDSDEDLQISHAQEFVIPKRIYTLEDLKKTLSEDNPLAGNQKFLQTALEFNNSDNLLEKESLKKILKEMIDDLQETLKDDQQLLAVYTFQGLKLFSSSQEIAHAETEMYKKIDKDREDWRAKNEESKKAQRELQERMEKNRPLTVNDLKAELSENNPLRNTEGFLQLVLKMKKLQKLEEEAPDFIGGNYDELLTSFYDHMYAFDNEWINDPNSTLYRLEAFALISEKHAKDLKNFKKLNNPIV
jgi:hypothetical protein